MNIGINSFHRAFTVLMPVVVAFLLAGCSASSHLERNFINSSPPPQHDMSVLVVPFQNLTVHSGAGVVVARLAATELYQAGLFTVHESPLLNAAQTAGASSGVDDPVAMARAAGSDAVLTGSVIEYGYRYGFRKQPVVGADIRLIRTDGSVLWAGSASEAGSAYLGRDSATEAAQRMVMRMVQMLEQKMVERKQ